MVKCDNCNQNVCTHGPTCSYKSAGNCNFCHCSDPPEPRVIERGSFTHSYERMRDLLAAGDDVPEDGIIKLGSGLHMDVSDAGNYIIVPNSNPDDDDGSQCDHPGYDFNPDTGEAYCPRCSLSFKPRARYDEDSGQWIQE